MKRRPAPEQQAKLALGDAPTDVAPLREAFERTALPAQGYTFEKAIENPAIRRCLVNVARARLIAQREASR